MAEVKRRNKRVRCPCCSEYVSAQCRRDHLQKISFRSNPLSGHDQRTREVCVLSLTSHGHRLAFTWLLCSHFHFQEELDGVQTIASPLASSAADQVLVIWVIYIYKRESCVCESTFGCRLPCERRRQTCAEHGYTASLKNYWVVWTYSLVRTQWNSAFFDSL